MLLVVVGMLCDGWVTLCVVLPTTYNTLQSLAGMGLGHLIRKWAVRFYVWFYYTKMDQKTHQRNMEDEGILETISGTSWTNTSAQYQCNVYTDFLRTVSAQRHFKLINDVGFNGFKVLCTALFNRRTLIIDFSF